MSKVFYNKLIRDHIQETITSKGESCEVRSIQNDAEFQQELLKKVVEEATAVSRTRTRDEFLDEYADLMVVLDTLTTQMEFSEADIKLAIEKNMERKGGYAKKHYLHWSDDSDYHSNESPQGIR